MKSIKNTFFISLLIFLFIFCYINEEKIAASNYLQLGERILTRGDEGPDVAILQRKLKNLSIYDDRIDGIFGLKTEKAVIIFQKKRDITVDGIVGPETYRDLPKEPLYSRMDLSRDEIIQLAYIIHGEARGESFKGKVAVGAVILNRIKSKLFPNTIREVILQRGQFSSLIDGQANLYPSEESISAAKTAMLGYDPTHGSLFFYNPRVATNLTWIAARPVVVRIGDHVFAR